MSLKDPNLRVIKKLLLIIKKDGPINHRKIGKHIKRANGYLSKYLRFLFERKLISVDHILNRGSPHLGPAKYYVLTEKGEDLLEILADFPVEVQK